MKLIRKYLRLAVAKLFPWLFRWKRFPYVRPEKLKNLHRFLPRAGFLPDLVLPNHLSAAGAAFGNVAQARWFDEALSAPIPSTPSSVGDGRGRPSLLAFLAPGVNYGNDGSGDRRAGIESSGCLLGRAEAFSSPFMDLASGPFGNGGFAAGPTAVQGDRTRLPAAVPPASRPASDSASA